MTENNAAQAVQESERNAAADEYFKPRAWLMDTNDNRRIFEAGFDRAYALLSKLRAEGVQAGDEREAFASHVSGRDDLELYQVENIIDANSTRWATWRAARDYYQQARAALASAPVAGEAQITDDDVLDILAEYGEHHTEHGRIVFDKWTLQAAGEALLQRCRAGKDGENGK